MAGNRQAIKARIKSINATKKITGAMNLISNVKLQKERAKLTKISQYSDQLQYITNAVLSGEHDISHPFLSENDVDTRFIIYLGSDLGMCGAYNVNLTKFLLEEVTDKDLVYVVGSNQYRNIKNHKVNVINELTPSDGMEFVDIKEIADKAISMYRKGEIKSINIVYSKFVNTVTFTPEMLTVLPRDYKTEHHNEGYIYLEPNPKDILEKLIPMNVRNMFYTKYVESKTSELGSRRMAMDNATDNATELVEKLTLEYNQARQAAITQEITEIVSGADAL